MVIWKAKRFFTSILFGMISCINELCLAVNVVESSSLNKKHSYQLPVFILRYCQQLACLLLGESNSISMKKHVRKQPECPPTHKLRCKHLGPRLENYLYFSIIFSFLEEGLCLYIIYIYVYIHKHIRVNLNPSMI